MLNAFVPHDYASVVPFGVEVGQLLVHEIYFVGSSSVRPRRHAARIWRRSSSVVPAKLLAYVRAKLSGRPRRDVWLLISPALTRAFPKRH